MYHSDRCPFVAKWCLKVFLNVNRWSVRWNYILLKAFYLHFIWTRMLLPKLLHKVVRLWSRLPHYMCRRCERWWDEKCCFGTCRLSYECFFGAYEELFDIVREEMHINFFIQQCEIMWNFHDLMEHLSSFKFEIGKNRLW